ncbi:MAG: ABC transporter ATP-binding protein [candidate division Zixibacteria bacterium]
MAKLRKSSPRILFPYLLKYKKHWVGGLLAVTLTEAFKLAGPWILGDAINALESGVTKERLLQYAAAIVGVILVSAIFRFIMRQTMIVASRRVEYDFRNDFFRHLLTLDRKYYDKTPTGDIMARATNDMDSVRSMIGPGIMYACSTAVTLALTLPLMIKISPGLTVYSMIPMPFITVLVFFLGREVNKRYTKIQEQYSAITARAQESFSGIRVVKAYTQEKAEIAEFSLLNSDYIKKNMSMVKVWAMFFPAIVMFSGTAAIMALWFGGQYVMDRSITLGGFVKFTAYLMNLIWPMAALGWVAGLYQRGKASLVRIEQILQAKPYIVNVPNPVSRDIIGKIELKNLRFGYNSTEVLRGITTVIEPGMNVALIGATGCGKTTLISLLLRAYPVERGMIYIDDVDINDWDLRSLRTQIAPVMQETFLFSETIRSNIAYGNYDQSMETVADFAAAAGMAGEIEEFPKKFDTLLGERGITLSGGQKQRTALARALSSDPRVLLLDDAFSSVDTHTEEEILSNLRQILKGKTSIMISHRISTVKDADAIMVLDDGNIVEHGDHDNLISLDGHYAKLYKRQLLESELEEL